MFSLFLVGFAAICFVAYKLVSNGHSSDLAKIPGPTLARYSGAWRLYQAWKGGYATTLKELHAKYGQFVRIGPNAVSIGNPEVTEVIYGIKTDFDRSDIATVGQLVYKGKLVVSLVTAKDKQTHATLRRPISNAYSMSTISSYEPFVDDVFRRFIKKVDEEFCETGRRWNIADWVQYLAYDVIFELTIGEVGGYIEHGSDFDGSLAALDKVFKYRGLVGQMPWLDKLLRNNIIASLFTPPSNQFLVRARKLLDDRMGGITGRPDRRDLVDRFIEAGQAHPDVVNDTTMMRYTATNLLAGSDTTSVAMRSIIYYTLKHPAVLKRLRAEIDAKVSVHPVPLKESGPEHLPYMDAVIREAFRVHFVGAGLIERVVPEGGLALPNGITLPQGTIVGASGWTIHFNKDIFGEDANEFNPARWLRGPKESEEAFADRLHRMKACDFTFSKGPRNCIGRWIVEMELRKIVPILFGVFDMRLAEPDKPWKVTEYFFTLQSDMDVFVSRRKQAVVSQ